MARRKKTNIVGGISIMKSEFKIVEKINQADLGSELFDQMKNL